MAKPLFNSLGSNYTPEMVAVANQYAGNPAAEQARLAGELQQQLTKQFKGLSQLVYKGRDAIELVCRPLAESSQDKVGVITQGLACHAIEEGMLRAGVTPIYADLEKGTLSPSLRTVKAALAKAKQSDISVKAVFLQHTLGYANPVAEIQQFCQEQQLLLIEDLAQSYGALDATGKLLGSYADAVIFSFGRDKVLDAVSGGAVVFKAQFWKALGRDGAAWLANQQPMDYPPAAVIQKEMYYPGLTQTIRSTHQSGVGKVVFKAAKFFGLLTSPIASAVGHPTKLANGYIKLVLLQLKYLDEQLKHRRQIAQTYLDAFAGVEELNCMADAQRLSTDIHLRLPILVKSEAKLKKIIAACAAQDIYISDRWYRDVVDSGSLNYPSVYKPGTCPEAEQVSKRLLNLPTHHHISVEDAQRIALVIIKSIE